MPHRGSQQKQRAILEAALACFASKGFAAATMADIRERAGASTGSIYHHFKSKEQIAAELYLDGVRQAQELGLRALLRQRTTEAGIRALVESYLDWVRDNPSFAAFVFAMRDAEFVRTVEGDLERIQREGVEAASDWFRARMVSGELPNLSPDVLRAVLYGPVAHFGRQWARGQADVDLETAKRQLAGAAWHALGGLRPAKS